MFAHVSGVPVYQRMPIKYHMDEVNRTKPMFKRVQILAKKTQLDMYSGGCEWSHADTIGVCKVDTKSLKVLGSHNMKYGFGYEPVLSPDSKYILLLGNDAGKSVFFYTKLERNQVVQRTRYSN
mmetsp:Transcript_18315/g.21082  ORF Transcript_18315/g.21082 Transcript_18315/m.21082 type:complete len:123 (-) Transcript_18315:842-1210(-)